MMVIRNPVGLTRGSEEIYHILVDTVDTGHIGRAEAGGWDQLGSTLGWEQSFISTKMRCGSN